MLRGNFRESTFRAAREFENGGRPAPQHLNPQYKTHNWGYGIFTGESRIWLRNGIWEIELPLGVEEREEGGLWGYDRCQLRFPSANSTARAWLLVSWFVSLRSGDCDSMGCGQDYGISNHGVFSMAYRVVRPQRTWPVNLLSSGGAKPKFTFCRVMWNIHHSSWASVATLEWKFGATMLVEWFSIKWGGVFE